MSQTIGELYGPAMAITDQAAADAYFEQLVQRSMDKWGKNRADAEQTVRCNLGYYAGYYNAETRERVERLFSCSHPVFGKFEERGQPTIEAALSEGKAAYAEHKHQEAKTRLGTARNLMASNRHGRRALAKKNRKHPS